jgi:hypothetical protein
VLLPGLCSRAAAAPPAAVTTGAHLRRAGLGRVLLHKLQHRLLRLGQRHGGVAAGLRQPAAAVLVHAPRVHARQHLLGLVDGQLRPLRHLLQRAVCGQAAKVVAADMQPGCCPKRRPGQRADGQPPCATWLTCAYDGNLEDGVALHIQPRHLKVCEKKHPKNRLRLVCDARQPQTPTYPHERLLHATLLAVPAAPDGRCRCSAMAAAACLPPLHSLRLQLLMEGIGI